MTGARANPATARLLQILELEALGNDVFRGDSELDVARLFGGQVVAQALRAATHTVNHARAAHSLHAYFLRSGSPKVPIEFTVERLRDGRSFAARRVTARQGADAILTLDASFHEFETGLTHAEPMPEVPPPSALQDDSTVARLEDMPGFTHINRRLRPFTMRSVFAVQTRTHPEDFRWNPVWIRFEGAAPDDTPDGNAVARCLLAYASDMGVVGTGSIPHRVPRMGLSMASLDHALWIHRRPPLGEWLLFAKRTSVAAHGRVLNRATFHTEAGEIIATVAQEGVMRMVDRS